MHFETNLYIVMEGCGESTRLASNTVCVSIVYYIQR